MPESFADLLKLLGDIPPWRVLLRPAPGTATEQDIFTVRAKSGRLCELLDGVLVEKAVGNRESLLGLALATQLANFVVPRRLGILLGSDATLRLVGGRVRMPDVSFISWGRLPDRRIPAEAVWELGPDLAVEVVSESNTPREMAIKRREYFAAGTALVWQINPRTRTADVFTAADQFTALDATGTLDGAAVLPGFSLPLADLFANLDAQAP